MKTEKGMTDWQVAALGKNQRVPGKRQIRRLLAKHPERVTVEPSATTFKGLRFRSRGDEK